MYVSSTHYNLVAEKIKNLPANRLLLQLMGELKQHSFAIRTIDVKSTDFQRIVVEDLRERVTLLDAHEEFRMQTMVANLSEINKVSNGIIFLCGASHAENLIKKLQENDLNHVHYYFPHSSQRLDESVDDINYMMNETLRGHTFCLPSDAQNEAFSRVILDEIHLELPIASGA
jgi:hypothetical protein